MTAVSYCDGDYAQMNVVTEEATMKETSDLRIILNKQSAARSATEQAQEVWSDHNNPRDDSLEARPH